MIYSGLLWSGQSEVRRSVNSKSPVWFFCVLICCGLYSWLTPSRIRDGENEGFAWSSEPGCYPWKIQRRGRIFYVSAPQISNSFFISRSEFLRAVKDLTAEWRY